MLIGQGILIWLCWFLMWKCAINKCQVTFIAILTSWALVVSGHAPLVLCILISPFNVGEELEEAVLRVDRNIT